MPSDVGGLWCNNIAMTEDADVGVDADADDDRIETAYRSPVYICSRFVLRRSDDRVGSATVQCRIYPTPLELGSCTEGAIARHSIMGSSLPMVS